MSKKKTTVEYDLFADFGAVDAENIVAGAVIKAAEDARNQEPTKKSQRIEDFGEKIGGARKDLYAAYRRSFVVEIVSCAELQKNIGGWRKKLESRCGTGTSRRNSVKAAKIFMANKRMGGKSKYPARYVGQRS